MQVIPAVDVLGGRVVRLTRGDYEAVHVYDEDPVGAARRWQEAGAPLVHVVDLEGARSGRPNPALWSALAAGGVRFQVGGGLRTAEAIQAALESGAERVVVGTTTVWNPELLAEIAEDVGPERLVAALDLRDGRARGRGWRDEGRPVMEVLEGIRTAGLTRVLVTAIHRDGTMEGPDLAVIGGVGTAAPELVVLASGGVGRLEDLEALAGLGVEGVVVGRALYEGRFTLEEALAVAG